MTTSNTGTVDRIDLVLEPTVVARWDEEDLLGSDLAGDQVDRADARLAGEMISACSFQLPRDIQQRELVAYAAQQNTPLGPAVLADSAHFDFHLIVVPLGIVVPAPQRLVRLRLILNLSADGAEAPVVVWDMYPHDDIRAAEVTIGEVNVDISKALAFVCPAPIADTLGLKLQFPLGWTTTDVVVDASGPMSNPAEWYVNDAAITSSFVGYAIVRAPKGRPVTVSAELVGDLRRPGPLGWVFKSHFRARPQTYVIGPRSS